MGLDTTHDCWHGAYSAFMRWRMKLGEISGIPLGLMEGYYHPDMSMPMGITKFVDTFMKDSPIYYVAEPLKQFDTFLPIRWEILKPDPALHFLLSHSDCEGDIPVEMLEPLAQRLEELLLLLPDEDAGGHIGNWREKTQKFIDGLRLAHSLNEPVEFG